MHTFHLSPVVPLQAYLISRTETYLELLQIP
eukprot:Gb_05296 [translate_table: standard]